MPILLCCAIDKASANKRTTGSSPTGSERAKSPAVLITNSTVERGGCHFQHLINARVLLRLCAKAQVEHHIDARYLNVVTRP